ncbi:hypothetical protein GCM10010195_67290 [Kitasatospora griseola]|nr:hypothetical protein GCM10010195_67290 [Kitasatospora griseola]
MVEAAGELAVSDAVGTAVKTGRQPQAPAIAEHGTAVRGVRIGAGNGTGGTGILPSLIGAHPAAESERGPVAARRVATATTTATARHAPAHPPRPDAPAVPLYSSRVLGGHHRSDDKELGMDTHGGQDGGGSSGGEGDGHPGTPWTPPEPPSPDGSTPPGDGGHRK